jgi:hypothetical protein
MIDLVWDDKFRRIFKKWSLQHPDLVPLFREKIEIADSGVLTFFFGLSEFQ